MFLIQMFLGNLEHFQEIIKDFDINAVFENGRNILHYIAEYGLFHAFTN